MRKLFIILAVLMLASGVAFAAGYGLVGGGYNDCGSFGGAINYLSPPGAIMGHWTHIFPDGDVLISENIGVMKATIDPETGNGTAAFAGTGTLNGNFAKFQAKVEVFKDPAIDDSYTIRVVSPSGGNITCGEDALPLYGGNIRFIY